MSMYIHVCACMRMYVSMCMYELVCMYVHVCACISEMTYSRYMHIHAHTCTYMHTCTYIPHTDCMYVHVFFGTYMQICTSVFTYMHIVTCRFTDVAVPVGAVPVGAVPVFRVRHCKDLHVRLRGIAILEASRCEQPYCEIISQLGAADERQWRARDWPEQNITP